MRSIFNLICRCFFLLLFILKTKINRQQSLYFFDIDNTLGNTFPTLQQKYISEKQRLQAIAMFPRMKKLILGLLQSPSRKVIFITSRPYKSWCLTHRWLLSNGLKVPLSDVIIVSSPMQKIEWLQKIFPRQKATFFIDDLSWNHENDAIKYYEQEIQLVSKLPLFYIGYSTILRFNSK